MIDDHFCKTPSDARNWQQLISVKKYKATLHQAKRSKDKYCNVRAMCIRAGRCYNFYIAKLRQSNIAILRCITMLNVR